MEYKISVLGVECREKVLSAGAFRPGGGRRGPFVRGPVGEGERAIIRNFGKNLVVIALFVTLIAMSVFSFSSVHIVRGNAHTINSAGLVRGLGQRLVKWELAGKRNNALVVKIESLIGSLDAGLGEEGQPGFADAAYRRSLKVVQDQWQELKAAIDEARRTGDRGTLFELSENFFEAADALAELSEWLSERNVDFILSLRTILIAISGALLVCFLLQSCESIQLLYRNRFLEEKATKDPMTSLPNRWSCDLQIEKYRHMTSLPEVTCFMADLNNLKAINDALGHPVGDRLIVAFARILADSAAPYGFVGRNGGDEFLGIFEGCDPERLRAFHESLRESVACYNETSDEFEIRFAFGAALSCELKKASIFALMNLAEQRMYKDKQEAKQAPDPV